MTTSTVFWSMLETVDYKEQTSPTSESLVNISSTAEDSATSFNETSFLFENYPAEILRTGFVFLSLCAGFGVFANALSMVALIRCSRLQNATTSLLVNLCFSDLLFCGTSTPFAVTVFFYGGWHYSHYMCVLFGVTRFLNVGSSVFTVVTIAINRLIMITHPIRYKQIFCPGNILVVISGIWLLSFSLVIWPTARLWGRFAWDPYIGTCSVVPHNGGNSKKFTFMFGYIVPMVVFLACYGRIFCIVRRSNRNLKQYNSGRRKSTAQVASMVGHVGQLTSSAAHQIKKQARKTENSLRLLRMVLVIFLTFTLCYLPLVVLKAFRILNHCPVVQVTAYLTFYLSGCIHPIIYICMSREYRKAYLDLFRREQLSCDVEASRDFE